MKIILLILLTFVLGVNRVSAVELNYKPNQIEISGCPAELVLYLPSNFRKPLTLNERLMHDRILSDLHSNKNRKTVYSNIFLANWDSPIIFPQIAVGSLGSLSKVQGEVTEKVWSDIKKNMMAPTESEFNSISNAASNLLLQDKNDIDITASQISKVYLIDDASIASIGELTSQVSGMELNIYTSMKMIYAKNCIAYINISVETKDKYAKEYFLSLIKNITVK